ncbi:MAG: SRPBCC family protein [Acidimicrobiia bacterium]
MLIESSIQVPHPVNDVWKFCQDIPQVAACLPGADLSEEIGPDHYAGTVAINMGPVSLKFAGEAKVVERDEENKTIVIDAVGMDETGGDRASLDLTVRLEPHGTGTHMNVAQELHLSGAAAQFGRGMVGDVTQVLMGDFGKNMQTRLDAFERGLAAHEIEGARSASGFMIGLRAAWMALKRVARRFFLPYEPSRV